MVAPLALAPGIGPDAAMAQGRIGADFPRPRARPDHLAEHPGEVVTKRQLLTDVWHQAWGGSDKTVDVHLSWLRRKLGETAAEPRYLHTVRGVGVRLAAPEA